MNTPKKITDAAWLRAPATTRLLDALGKADISLRFVGGCLRDHLAGRAVKDLDLATPAEPTAVMAALKDSAMTVIPTGLDHGTVTVLVDHQPFEITTLRRDVSTDGRRATVAFTQDWAEDAARRDLTINAIYCGRDGVIFDPFDGVADLAAGRVRFVGVAEARIKEDYLRILRFFRFHAFFGKGALDEAGLRACANNAAGITQLSRERLRAELLRLLDAPAPQVVLAVMRDQGILDYVLPGVTPQGLETLTRLIAGDKDKGASDALLRLGALIGDPARTKSQGEALRLSNSEQRRLQAMLDDVVDLPTSGPQAWFYRLGKARARDALRLMLARGEDQAEGLWRALDDWTPPHFPLAGDDLKALGLDEGAALGALLKAAEAWWIDGGFQADRDACLAEAKKRIRLQGSPE